MALFLNQNDKRSELQERVVADLRAKANESSLREKATMDGELDLRFMEGTKPTTTLSPAWLLIAIMAIVIITAFVLTV